MNYSSRQKELNNLSPLFLKATWAHVTRVSLHVSYPAPGPDPFSNSFAWGNNVQIFPNHYYKFFTPLLRVSQWKEIVQSFLWREISGRHSLDSVIRINISRKWTSEITKPRDKMSWEEHRITSMTYLPKLNYLNLMMNGHCINPNWGIFYKRNWPVIFKRS